MRIETRPAYAFPGMMTVDRKQIPMKTRQLAEQAVDKKKGPPRVHDAETGRFPLLPNTHFADVLTHLRKLGDYVIVANSFLRMTTSSQIETAAPLQVASDRGGS